MSTSNPSSNPSNTPSNNTTSPPTLSENYATCDLDKMKATQMWLVRVPHKLATAWEAASEGDALGTLTFTKGTPPPSKINTPPTSSTTKSGARKGYLPPSFKQHVVGGAIKQSITIKVPPNFAAQSSQRDLPLEYTAEAMTKKVPVLIPFCRDGEGAVRLDGVVSRAANLQITRGDTYRKLCRNRLMKTVTSNRYVRPVDVSELSMRGGTSGGGVSGEGFGDAVQKHGKRLLEAQEMGAMDGGKKVKFEGQSARSVVFELFSGQRYWTVKELRQASGRLERELRPVLAELCEFHRSGEQKGTWELKKEFQMQGNA